MTGDGYSDYYGTHGQGETSGLPMDSLSRRARRRTELERMRSATCTCGHQQIQHDDGRGQCMDWYHVSRDERQQCWCVEFEARAVPVRREWRQTS